jgi:hypothetical protein
MTIAERSPSALIGISAVARAAMAGERHASRRRVR